MSSAGNYADFDEYIEYQIKKTRSGIKLTELVTTGLAVAVFVVGYLFAFTLLDHWVIPGGFSIRTRAILLGIVVLTAAGWITWKLVLPWFKNITGLYAANAIEESDPEIKSAVLNFVDAKRSGRQVQPHILKAMEKRAAIRLNKTDVDRAVDRSGLMRLAYALLGLVVGCCIYTVFSPKQISLARALSVAETSVATQTEFLEIAPGDVQVLAGEFVDITVDLRGDIPERVFAYTTTEDRGLVDEPIDLRPVEDEEGRFAGRVNGANGRGILQPMTYRIVAGDAESRDFQISVIAAPSAVMDRVDLVYPEYMEFPESTVPGGDIDTWEGAEVTFHARTNMPVSVAMLQFADHPDAKGEEIRMEIEGGGRTLTGSWTAKARSDGSFPKHYRVLVKTEAGQADPNPLLYNVNVKPDESPEVELLDPVVDLEMPSNGIVPLLVQARDKDFKLRSVTLRMQKEGEELPPEELIFDGLTSGYRKQITETYDLRLGQRRLLPGDIVSFYIEARDNKPPLGNKAVTQPITIRIVAPVARDKVEEQLEKRKQKQQEKLDERREEQRKQQEENQQGGEGESGETTDGEAGEEEQQTGSGTGETGEPGNEQDGNPGDSDPNQEKSDDSQGGEGDNDRTDKADDDEALQKLIEKMKEREQEQGENQPSDDPNNGKGGERSADPDPEGNPNEEPGENQAEPGDEPENDQKQGDQKQGDQKQGDQKQGDQKQGDQKQGDQKQGDQKQGDQKQGDQKQGDQKQGDQKQGDQKQGDQKQGDQKQGDQKQGDQKQGDQKQGDQKQGDQKQGDQKQGDQKQGDQKQGDQKQGDQKQGDQKQGDQKQGDQKQGDQKQGDQKQGDQKQGDQKQGDQKQGDASGKPGDSKSAPSGKPTANGQPAKGADSNQGPGEGKTPPESKPKDPNLEDAKNAANLVLKQIDDEMQRGEVDEETLKELGWTKEDLKKFSDRMRKRLNQMEDATDEESLQKQREFKEMLKSLNLKPRKNDREGSKKRDRITDGVNTRSSPPPADLRELYEAYKRSLSKRRKSK